MPSVCDRPLLKKPKKNENKAQPTKANAKLSLLPSLPLDVLFEIFGHLPPIGLLNLSRTTKDFRRLLLHKSAVSIWKTSLRHISGVPACPPDMSEPAWVNLVFSAFCHGPNCTRRSQKVDWLLRIRLCDKCAKESDVLRPDKELDGVGLECIPLSCTFRIRGHKGQCCLAKDVQEFTEELSLVSQEERATFIAGRKKALADRETHAAACKEWVDEIRSERWDELSEIKDQRRDDIYDKLEALGFIEELEYLENLEGTYDIRPPLLLFDDHPDIKISKPLTERSWKNMEERVVGYMHRVREHMHAADRLDIVREREKVAISAWVQFRLKFPAVKLVPSGSDIIFWPEVKAITELHSCIPTRMSDVEFRAATPGPAPITPSSFTRVFEANSAVISEWENDRIRELGYHNKAGSCYPFNRWTSSAQLLNELRLAVCVFTCEDPRGIHHVISHFDGFYPAMWYPEFLHHPCNTVGRTVHDKNVPWNSAFQPSEDFGWLDRKEWNMDSMFFDEKASRGVKKIIAACGLDENVVTTEELDTLDPWFICLKCSYGAKADGQRSRKVMPWRNAVQHTMLKHWGDGAVTWEKVTDESAEEARKLSASQSIAAAKMWRCAHCRDSARERDGKDTKQLVKTHLSQRHKITEGILGRDYFRAVDCPPPQKASVQMTPKAALS